MQQIRVLIVDDSALVRRVLSEILGQAGDISVVGTATDAYAARQKIKQLNPDVLTLDVEMPRMDGVTFLGNLMRLRPMPVVMVSSLTEQGVDITLRALELGAVDFVAKPRLDVAEGLKDYGDEILEKVRAAAKARVNAIDRPAKAVAAVVTARHSVDVILQREAAARHVHSTHRIIGIGASTGGTEAVKEVLAGLPADIGAGVVISQHIPAAFSAPFARRVDGVTPLSVCEARDGQQILPGQVCIAPGNRHLLIERDGAGYVCRLNDGPPVNRHRPSVDVMLRSLAQNAGANAIGLMLTGMGDDGAAGMGELKQAGAPVVAQDEKTSVVWGMPGEVVKRGFADQVLPLGKIASQLRHLVDT